MANRRKVFTVGEFLCMQSQEVKCLLCKTEIDILNMEVSALDSHAAGKKHTHETCQIVYFKW